MEREEKVRERDGGEEGEAAEEEKEELMGLKLKRSILVGKGKRGGPCTPPPTWNSLGSHSQTLNTATARQIGANLWEILPNMTNTAASSSSSFHRRHGNHHHHKNKGLQIQPVLEEDDDDISECSSHLPDQPGSSGSFHRQIAESLRRHHRSVNRNGRAIQPVSPASFGSSMENKLGRGHRDKVQQFMAITGASEKDALQVLKAIDWHLESAFDVFYSQPQAKTCTDSRHLEDPYNKYKAGYLLAYESCNNV